ncbi:MAG TPA: TetR/AcrR family transcriptional regulator [Polyangiaceae bacterium]|nr:TetR/AcrR family transcriptional regulator [Polyangiaceae bacterium]
MSRREALLQATKALLWRRGYAATSPADILKESRSGQGSLYHFFKGKEELAALALREVEQESSQRIAAVCAPDTGTGLERLERFLLADRDALQGCRLGRMTQDPELPDSLRSTVSDGLGRLQAVLADAARDAKREDALPAGLDADALADVAIAVVQGGYVLSRAHQDPSRMTSVVRTFHALLQLCSPPKQPTRKRPAKARSGPKARQTKTSRKPRKVPHA